MEAQIPLEPYCQECKSCTYFARDITASHQPFQVKSISPTDGIDFRCGCYTARAIANAFTHLIPGHMDWKIKRRALKRWKALVPALLNGTKKFDLPRMFRILDDFLFMRALQDAGSVEWEDVRPEGIKYRGITVYNPNVRGPIFWIRVTKSSPLDNWSVQDFIVTLLHEMCHALLSFSCRCVACTCNLNKINSHGLLGHGPSWQSVLQAVEETANLHLLSGLGNPYLLPPFRLCAESVFSFETEETAKTKMLGDLYEKVKAEADAIAQLKKFERETKRAGRVDNTPENFLVELEEEQALASIAGMFTEM